MALRLFTRVAGRGRPVIFLHGLLGSSDNWLTEIETFSRRRKVIAPDLRNHGRSPHDGVFDYDAFASDLDLLYDDHGLASAVLVGHSLGGKTAMFYALTRPERVEKLVVEDISPGRTAPTHAGLLNDMRAVNFSRCRSRADVDRLLQPDVPSATVREFLLKSVESGPDGRMRWRVHLEALIAHYEDVNAPLIADAVYPGPALFIRGGRSDYLPPDAEGEVKKRFPNARIETIADAGHWVHGEQPEAFARLVEAFLDGRNAPAGGRVLP